MLNKILAFIREYSLISPGDRVICAVSGGADSMALLRCVAGKLKEAGYRVSNVDVTMIAQQPKLKPYIPQMMENLAADLEIGISRVNVKATTEEGLGFTGNQEGMACHAVCLLEE